MQNKFKFLHNFFKIIEELNIDYWLEGGTALAAYRDGKILPWEHDFDIGVMKEDMDRNITLFLDKLKDLNCDVIVQKNYPFIDNIIQIYSNDKTLNPNQIDIYLYTKKHENIYMRWLSSPIGYGSQLIKIFMYLSNKKMIDYLNNNNFLYFIYKILFIFFFYINILLFKSRYHSFPKKFFKEKIKVNFCNLKLNLPSMINEFLVYRYGKDWNKPDRNFNQSGKWKFSKGRPILRQSFLNHPVLNFKIHKDIKHVNK